MFPRGVGGVGVSDDKYIISHTTQGVFYMSKIQ
jgi:hypothetical protein